MGRLLKLEWLKLQHNRSFQVILLLYMVALPALFLSGKGLDTSEDLPLNTFYMFPHVWSYLGYIGGNWIGFFCFGFLGVILITLEYSNKTMRQNIMTGLSRSEFLTGKFLMVAAISLFAALYYAALSITFGYIYTDHVISGKVLQESYLFFMYFFQCFCYMSMALFLGLLMKRSGLAIFIYIIYSFVIEFSIRKLFHDHVFGLSTSRFYPQNSFEDLVPIPRGNAGMIALEKGIEEANGLLFLDTSQAVMWSLIWVSLFIGTSYLLINKRDL